MRISLSSLSSSAVVVLSSLSLTSLVSCGGSDSTQNLGAGASAGATSAAGAGGSSNGGSASAQGGASGTSAAGSTSDVGGSSDSAGGSGATGGSSDSGAGGSTTSGGGSGQGATGGSNATGGASAGGASSAGAANGGASSGGSADTGDGTPMRNQCLQVHQLGPSLTTDFGRLDGYLVSIVPPTQKGCNSDNNHLHLQVTMMGGVYDVAIDVQSDQATGTAAEVLFDQLDFNLPSGPWTEGWHTNDPLDYVKTLGLHDTQFTAIPEAMLLTDLEGLLANVNHISVYGTGYGPSGMHDIHYKSTNEDGALVLEPTSPKPHFLVFHFSNQSF